MIRNRVASIMVSAIVFCFIVCASTTGAKADDSDVKVVDGSYLLSADSSTGHTPKSNERGEHLMDGECSITKAGTKRIYTYGATTANHTVDTVAVIVYVERYDEKDDEWYQIDATLFLIIRPSSPSFYYRLLISKQLSSKKLTHFLYKK